MLKVIVKLLKCKSFLFPILYQLIFEIFQRSRLIAHYELGNTEMMEYYIRSTYRFMLKKGDLNQYQKYILAFLRKLASGFKQEDLLPEFRLLLKQLRSLQNVRYEQRAFVYFDIISWLESKIHNRAVGDVIREKALKRIGGG